MTWPRAQVTLNPRTSRPQVAPSEGWKEGSGDREGYRGKRAGERKTERPGNGCAQAMLRTLGGVNDTSFICF